jgi:Tol biopolymer transport system component
VGRRLRWNLALTLVAIASCRAGDRKTTTFSVPDSVLLFENSGSELLLVTTTGVRTVKLPTQPSALSYPALARDGSQIALGFAAYPANTERSRRFVFEIYSVTRQTWKNYGDFEKIGVAAFSPDGSRVAFAAVPAGGRGVVLILDLSSGEMTPLAHPLTVPQRANLGWSPDGKRLVVETESADHPPAISVVDPGTNDVKTIAEGVDPVWSPTGEWIAYFDQERQKCILVHPDGTGARVVRNLRQSLLEYRLFFYGAVWSPDGKRLLFDEMKGEGPNIDVMQLDLAGGRVTRKSKNGSAVFGWAERKRSD